MNIINNNISINCRYDEAIVTSSCNSNNSNQCNNKRPTSPTDSLFLSPSIILKRRYRQGQYRHNNIIPDIKIRLSS